MACERCGREEDECTCDQQQWWAKETEPREPASDRAELAPPAEVAGTPSFEPAWTQYEPTPPLAGARRRGRVVRAGAAVIAAGALVAAALALTSSGHKSANAQTIVADSVSSALAGKTAQMTISMNITVGTTNLAATGVGGIDFTAGSMRMLLSTSEAGRQIPLTLELVAGTIYEQIPGLDQLLPGKSWVSIDITSAEKAAGEGTGVFAGAGNPAAMLRLLAGQGNSVQSIGASTVDGVTARGYRVVYNTALLTSPKVIASLPSWMQSAVKGVDFAGQSADVYIDRSGKLVRFTMIVDIQSPTAMHINETMDLSGYGTPVSVSAPDPSQVATLQQLLQAAQNSSSGA